MEYGVKNSSALITVDTEKQLLYMESIDDNYSFHIRAFCNWIREINKPIDFQTLQDYFIELKNSKYAARTVNVKRQAVKKRIRQLQENGEFNPELAIKIDKALSQLDREPKTKARKINTSEIGKDKIITVDEFNRLMDYARSDKQRRFMAFLWSTGCRISELTGIRLEHCKEENGKVTIRVTGKGSKERFLKITSDLYDSILNTFRSKNYLFSTSTGKPYTRSYISGQIAKLGKYVLNRTISAHSFRHSFATRKISETKKIKAVSRYLGHSSTAITMNLYVHEEMTDDELFL